MKSSEQHSASTLHVAINGWFAGNALVGSGQYIDYLLTHLPHQSRPVQISLLVPRSNLAAAQRVAQVTPHITLIPCTLPRRPRFLRKLWWEQVTVPRVTRQIEADVLWVPYWAAPAWQPCPTVVTVHDLIPALLPAYRGNHINRLYTALVSWTARRATSIITISQTSARDIITHLGVPPERVHVVYHGPNQAATASAMSDVNGTEAAVIRARYNLPERYFLYLGGYDSRKNVASIIAAYARYRALGGDPAIKLVLAGNVPKVDTAFAPDPRPIVAAHGLSEAVYYTGRVAEEDKAMLYALATAFLFPSLYEGFGMMLLEAMVAGTPVITSGD